MIDWSHSGWKTPKGWDARDPEGCWMKDLKTHEQIDYCEGKQAFYILVEAIEYAFTLKWWSLIFDKQGNYWVVEEMDGHR